MREENAKGVPAFSPRLTRGGYLGKDKATSTNSNGVAARNGRIVTTT
jgi:hypothetical protein